MREVIAVAAGLILFTMLALFADIAEREQRMLNRDDLLILQLSF